MSRIGKRIPPYLGIHDLIDLLHGKAIHYILSLESLDGSATYVTNSGSVTLDFRGIRLSTGTTAGSRAHVNKGIELAVGYNLFNYRFRALFLCETLNGEVNLTGYVVVGDVRDFTRYVGFKIDTDGKLYGCVCESGSETVVDLAYSIPAGSAVLPPLEARFYPGVKAEFYVGGAKKGETTTGLPSGSATASRVFSADAVNADAVDRQLRIGYFSLFRWLV